VLQPARDPGPGAAHHEPQVIGRRGRDGALGAEVARATWGDEEDAGAALLVAAARDSGEVRSARGVEGEGGLLQVAAGARTHRLDPAEGMARPPPGGAHPGRRAHRRVEGERHGAVGGGGQARLGVKERGGLRDRPGPRPPPGGCPACRPHGHGAASPAPRRSSIDPGDGELAAGVERRGKALHGTAAEAQQFADRQRSRAALDAARTVTIPRLSCTQATPTSPDAFTASAA
jgi:hypothetical protein